MACTDERANQIAELAGGRLDGGTLDEVLDHVEGCTACSAELDLAAELVAEGARPATIRAVPPSLDPSSMMWPVAAAALLMVLLGFWGATRGDEAPPVDPTTLAVLAPLPAPGGALRAPVVETAGWDEAMRHYSAGRWGEAARSLEATTPTDEGRALRDLYVGLVRAQLGDYELAGEALGRAADAGTGMVRERARWFRAQVRLAAGNTAEARSLLEQILTEDGEYAPNASAQLDELGR